MPKGVISQILQPTTNKWPQVPAQLEAKIEPIIQQTGYKKMESVIVDFTTQII